MESGLAKASPPEVSSQTSFSDRKSENDDGDGGDAASSRYSSCGESEFERYCSANSAMGTPSVCSSTFTAFNDLSEAEFGGSARSLGLGFGDSDGGGLESFSLGGKIERDREEMGRLSAKNSVREWKSGLNYGSSGFELYAGDEVSSFPSESVSDGFTHWKVESESVPLRETSEFEEGESHKGSGSGNEEVLGKYSTSEHISNGSRGSPEVEECGGEGRSSDGNVEETEGLGDETSSRDEHSEGEDSMYNYCTDSEDKKVEFRYYRNVDRPKEEKTRDENPFLINSSTAFGLDDWDDFVQESGGIGLPSVPFSPSDLKNREEQGVEAKMGFSDSPPADSIGHPSSSQTDEEKVATSQVESDDKLDGVVCSPVAQLGLRKVDEPKKVDDVKDIPVASYQIRSGSDVIEFTKSSLTTPTFAKVQKLEKEEANHIPHTKNQLRGGDELPDYSKNLCLDDDICDVGLEPLAEEYPEKLSFDNACDGLLQVHRNTSTEETLNVNHSRDSENQGLASRDSKMHSIYNSPSNRVSSRSTMSSRTNNLNLLDDSKPKTETLNNSTKRNSTVPEDHGASHSTSVKADVLELNEFYNEVVLDMEEILLTSNESPGGRFSHSNNRALQSQQSIPLRDGGLSASTSGTDDPYLFANQLPRIDEIEVVGARQKKGDVSFGERLVGVKEYTVYKIRVWSGNDQWEVERRYRDFFTLYRRLRTLFASQNWVLPAPWATVEKESRKIFGNASPDVVSERSVLIQESLRSILQLRFFTTPPSALIWFLSPQDSLPNSPASNTAMPRYLSIGNRENVPALGKTISLIVEIQPYKSVKQMLEAQHYTCAGCYKHFDDGKTLIRDFAQTFGWGKPRLCEYTSQLFCSSCHGNETAVLPARVLHNWDFTQYPVSQMAKSYLDSIHDQPMLCVSAVNPFLFSKVPTLLHVMGVRRKIESIFSYVRCSFRGSINRGLGSRRYLLESNDFFALRDLVDLSKGAFAVLPVMVETVLKKIVEHITEQCLVCCDVGVPCNARQACNDPSSLIFPFQQGDVEKCPSCESIFHKGCFRKLTECHCGAHLRVGESSGLTRRLSSGALDFLGKGLGSSLSTGFLSSLFTKAKPEALGDRRDDDNVILMGSLPSTSL